MSFSQTESTGCVIVTLNDTKFISLHTQEFNKMVNSLLEDEKCNVVLDIAQVAYMDSMGLGSVLSTLKALRQKGGDLVLLNCPELVWRLIETAGLGKLFKSFSSVEDAVQNFA